MAIWCDLSPLLEAANGVATHGLRLGSVENMAIGVYTIVGHLRSLLGRPFLAVGIRVPLMFKVNWRNDCWR